MSVSTMILALFNYILVNSIEISIVIILMFGVDLIFRNMSPLLRYSLWVIVLFRLIFPFDFLVHSIFTHVGTEPSSVVYQTVFKDLINRSASLPIPASGPTLDILKELVAYLWFGLFLFLAVLVSKRLYSVRKYKKSGQEITREDIKQLLTALKQQMNINKPLNFRMIESEMLTSPAVLGVVTPTILLPQYIIQEWTEEEIKPLLLHELAHIKQHDQLINYAQIFAQVLYFYHPLVWLMNWRIRNIREEVCDDIAVVTNDRKRKRYSQSIFNVLSNNRKSQFVVFGDIGFLERKSSLSRRMVRLLDNNYTYYSDLKIRQYAVLLLLFVCTLMVSCDSNISILGPSVEVIETDSVKGVVIHKPEIKFFVEALPDGTYKFNDKIMSLDEILEALGKEVKGDYINHMEIIVHQDTSVSMVHSLAFSANKVGINMIGVQSYE